MKTEDYFKTELDVHFTCNELHKIAYALATLSFKEYAYDDKIGANDIWTLRNKVVTFIDKYNK